MPHTTAYAISTHETLRRLRRCHAAALSKSAFGRCHHPPLQPCCNTSAPSPSVSPSASPSPSTPPRAAACGTSPSHHANTCATHDQGHHSPHCSPPTHQSLLHRVPTASRPQTALRAY